MNYVKVLKNFYKGKIGLVIGSGESAKHFDFSVIPTDWIIIVPNFCFLNLPKPVDFVIHTDRFFCNWVSENGYPILYNKIVSYEKVIFRLTDYYFDFEIFKEGCHTGFYALQLAELLGLKKIFLIGFDYKFTSDNKAHYYEGKISIYPSEKRMIQRVLEKGYWLKDFDYKRWKSEIYNLNPDSNLNKFQFLNWR